MDHAIVKASGNFTVLKYIAHLPAERLEAAVGFERGRLKNGFRVVALSAEEAIGPDEFTLQASTRWSAGAIHRTPHGAVVGIEAILAQRGTDLASTREKVAAFFARRGQNTPAKVIPNLAHAAGMLYPDAEALGPGIRSGIPQFNLNVTKRFVVVREE